MSYAERREELTQRLKWDFKKGKEIPEKMEAPRVLKNPNRPEDGGDQDTIRESPKVSPIDEGSEQVPEVEEEEVATATTHGDNIAAYAEPTLPQIHDHFLDAVSGQILLETSCGLVEVTAFIGNSITTIALQDGTMAIVTMDYNITIMARMERGQVVEVTPIRIQALAAEVSDYTGITDPEVMADDIDLPLTPLLVDILCSSITAQSLSLWGVATK
ncbi:hypothetical protein B9Z19DRAFT_1134268 [Tuber borchii]|uniref:Uncharacterized protein n=1 Tax=Tuber borchii TaxID=42251 RepID=A0A2T6ZEF5_TUBBO|nr:hypothetical protein B9Z19DRAFT_1134268 [Tuber borchii]